MNLYYKILIPRNTTRFYPDCFPQMAVYFRDKINLIVNLDKVIIECSSVIFTNWQLTIASAKRIC